MLSRLALCSCHANVRPMNLLCVHGIFSFAMFINLAHRRTKWAILNRISICLLHGTSFCIWSPYYVCVITLSRKLLILYICLWLPSCQSKAVVFWRKENFVFNYLYVYTVHFYCLFLYVPTNTHILLLLVFSPWAGLGRDQSSVRRLVWLWYAASWASS